MRALTTIQLDQVCGGQLVHYSQDDINIKQAQAASDGATLGAIIGTFMTVLFPTKKTTFSDVCLNGALGALIGGALAYHTDDSASMEPGWYSVKSTKL